MSAINIFTHSTAKFFSCIGSLLAGEYDVTAPGVSNSAYLGGVLGYASNGGYTLTRCMNDGAVSSSSKVTTLY